MGREERECGMEGREGVGAREEVWAGRVVKTLLFGTIYILP